MSLSVQDWKDLHAGEPTDVAEALFAAASKGDWDSILQADRAKMFAPEVESSMRALRLVAALSVLDYPALAPAQRATLGETFQKWLEDVSQDALNVTLFRAVDPPRYFPNACRALLGAGADPYSPGPEHRPADSCINVVFIRRDGSEALELMDLLFGDGPITDPEQLPARFVSGHGVYVQKFNLLEMCAKVSRYDLTDSILARIVSGSAAESIVFNLGDRVLNHLWMTPDGTNIARGTTGDPTVNSVDVSMALKYLAAGAKLRDPALWSKVARKTLRADDDEMVHLIDCIASDLTAPDFKNSAAATSRRDGMPRIVDVFLEHGALKVDEIIRDGRTMLMHAAAQDEPTWVAYLLEKGADPRFNVASRKGRKGITASEIAAAKGAHECARMIDAFVAKEAISRVVTQSRQPEPGR